MIFKKIPAIAFLMAFLLSFPFPASAEEGQHDEHKDLDVKEIIFEHLGDGYGWEVPFDHHHRIPLPVMVWAEDGTFHCFSSSRINNHAVYIDGDYTWQVPAEGPNKGKVVQIKDGKEIKPAFDMSITKNVCALWIAVLVTLAVCLPVARWHKKHGYIAPRGFVGAIESLIEFIYKGVIKPTLGEDSRKFAPYLLTVFMFIFLMNLLGLIVVFNGGENITGNIAVTLVM